MVVVIGGAAGVDRQRHWWFAVANGAAPSSSSILCFSFFSLLLLLLFFSFGLLPLFSALALFYSLSFFPHFLSALSSPVFIGKKTGERDWGGAVCCHPPPPLQHMESVFGQVGLVGVFLRGSRCLFEERDGGDRGRKNLLLPLSHASRGRRRPTVPTKQHRFDPFCFFFREQCMKWRRFGQNVLFHLKGKGGKNVSDFTLVLNLWFVQSNPKLQFWFKNQFNCIPAKS